MKLGVSGPREPQSVPEDLGASRPGPELAHLLDTGEHLLLRAGDLAAARGVFDGAARLALLSGDVDAFARASLGLGGVWVHEHRTAIEARRVQAWQRRALELVDESSTSAARLRTRLAAESDYQEGTYGEVLAALASARTLGDDVVLAEALSLAHHCLLGPEHAELRLELSDELLMVAGMTGRQIDEVIGLLWRTVDLLLVGDPHAERSLRELREVTTRAGLRAVDFVLSAIDVMRLVRRGDLDAAEAGAAATFELGRQTGDSDCEGWYAAQLINIRWYQDRLGELVPMLGDIVNSPSLATPNESLLAAYALATAQAGDLTTATGALRRVRGAGLAALRPSSTWLVTLSAVIEAAALTGDADLSAEAYDLLAPYADRPMMGSLAVVCFGSVQHCLGRAASTAGKVPLAELHLEAAVRSNEALEHRPALALSQRGLAELRAHPRVRPAERRATCSRIPSGWQIDLDATSLCVADSVGMGYLATLIAQPGRDLPAVQLACGVDEATAGGGPVLDAEARQAYAGRARQLQSELEEAELGGEHERAAGLRDELDWLLAEVQRATGLGGRSRRFADQHERARTSVQKAIRRAIAQIRKANPEVAQVIENDVVTGSRCCYQPLR